MRFTSLTSAPAELKCVWPSMKPGTTKRPFEIHDPRGRPDIPVRLGVDGEDRHNGVAADDDAARPRAVWLHRVDLTVLQDEIGRVGRLRACENRADAGEGQKDSRQSPHDGLLGGAGRANPWSCGAAARRTHVCGPSEMPQFTGTLW